MRKPKQFLASSNLPVHPEQPGTRNSHPQVSLSRLSTGPTTPEGMARTIAAMKAGRLRWLAQLKSEGKPIPCGRKKGGHNAPLEEREHAAYVRECERKYRDVVRRGRAERKARRAQRRQEREETRRRMEEHARRKARADVGGPYWTEEEWEKI